MKTFTDADGREWNIRLTIGMAKRLQEECKIDLNSEADITRLGTDQMQFFRAIAFVLRTQMVERNLTVDDLENAMDGAALEAATEAFVDELLFFTPNRRLAKKAMPAFRKRQEKILDELAERIETGQMDEAIAKAANSAFGKPSAAPAESSAESTPALSPSVNSSGESKESKPTTGDIHPHSSEP